jgi:hypothetical protein
MLELKKVELKKKQENPSIDGFPADLFSNKRKLANKKQLVEALI